MDDYAFALLDDGSIVYFSFNETPSLEHEDGSMVRLYIGETPSSKLVKPMYYLPPIDYEILEETNSVFGQYYLVQSGSDLLMILRYKDHITNPDDTEQSNYDILYETKFFRVFKLDPKNKKWEEIEDLGDVAFFLGCNSSLCVSTVAAKYLQRSCVYFTDDQDDWWSDVTDGGGHDMGVSNVINNDLWQFYEGDDTRSHFNPPIWFIPKF